MNKFDIDNPKSLNPSKIIDFFTVSQIECLKTTQIYFSENKEFYKWVKIHFNDRKEYKIALWIDIKG